MNARFPRTPRKGFLVPRSLGLFVLWTFGPWLAAIHAQSAVPGTITYQGKVSDASGALIGTGTPVNRVVTFRVYDHVSSTNATNRLYSEKQTVTIANGEFNVLVGGGTALDTEPNTLALSDVFTGATRYLGVTVDDGNVGADPEISPRQQIVTMPYAFRSKVAESVIGSATDGNIFQSSGNVGIGTNTPVAPLTLYSPSSDAKFLLQTPSSGTGSSDGLAIVHSNAGYILEYEAVPLHFGTNAQTRMSISASGNVGIGTTTPGTLLSLGNALANIKLALWDDNAGSHYGLGVQGNQFRLQVPGTADRFSFLTGVGANPVEVFTLHGSGKVGIGVTAPIANVHVFAADSDAKILLQHPGTGTTSTSGLALIESNRGYLWQYSNLPLVLGTNNTPRLTISPLGNVGIGTESPGALLSLGGSTANTKLALWDNDGGGTMYGLGMGGNQLRFHTSTTADRFSFLSSAAGTEVFTIKSSGNVGIGISSPTVPLHIHSSSGDSRVSFTTPATGVSASDDGLAVGTHASYGFIWQYENLPLVLATNTTERMRIEADGRIGIGAPNPYAFAQVYVRAPSTARNVLLQMMDGNGNEAYSFQHGGLAYKGGGGSWYATSDIRLKTDIHDLTGALDQLLKLRSVTFLYKDQVRNPTGLQTGFVAQEVEEIFPDWVSTRQDGMKMVGTRGFEARAVQALRELRAEKDAQIAERDTKIAALEQRVRTLESRESAAEARFSAIERRL